MLNDHNQKLFLVRGLSGSGKSFLAARIAAAYNADHWESDLYFFDEVTLRYNWDRDKAQHSHKWCQHKAALSLLSGRNVVVANTFPQLDHLDPYYAMALMRPTTEVYVLEPTTEWSGNPEECIKHNAHGIPRHLVETQAELWETFQNFGSSHVKQLGSKFINNGLFTKEMVWLK